MDPQTIAVIVAAIVLVAVVVWRLFFKGAAAPAATTQGVAGATPADLGTTRKSKAEITKILEANGYKVKDIEFDDGVYEVEAYQNDEEFEIKVDPYTGKILKIENDD